MDQFLLWNGWMIKKASKWQNSVDPVLSSFYLLTYKCVGTAFAYF